MPLTSVVPPDALPPTQELLAQARRSKDTGGEGQWDTVTEEQAAAAKAAARQVHTQRTPLQRCSGRQRAGPPARQAP